jgi:hypothetical protein
LEGVKMLVTDVIAEDVKAEMKLLETRARAIKLVLGYSVGDLENDPLPEAGAATVGVVAAGASPSEVAAGASPSDVAAGAEAADEQKEGAAEDGEKDGSEDNEEKAERVQIAGPKSEAGDLQEAAPRTPRQGDSDRASRVGHSPPPAREEAATTVEKFIQRHGGSTKALKKYIASFSGPEISKELGSQPPCRSYRTLRCLSEWEDVEAKLADAKTKEEITAIHAASKPFKQAYSDLMNMAKAACNRATHAIKKALENTEKSKKHSLDAKASASTQAAKKRRAAAAASAPQSVFSLKHTIGTSIPVVSVSKELTLAGEVDITKPVILRFDARVVNEGRIKAEVDAF